MLSLNLLIGLMFFRDLFSIVITSLLEERAGLYASRAFVCLSCMRCFFFCFVFFLFLFLVVSGVGCGW